MGVFKLTVEREVRMAVWIEADSKDEALRKYHNYDEIIDEDEESVIDEKIIRVVKEED